MPGEAPGDTDATFPSVRAGASGCAAGVGALPGSSSWPPVAVESGVASRLGTEATRTMGVCTATL